MRGKAVCQTMSVCCRDAKSSNFSGILLDFHILCHLPNFPLNLPVFHISLVLKFSLKSGYSIEKLAKHLDQETLSCGVTGTESPPCLSMISLLSRWQHQVMFLGRQGNPDDVIDLDLDAAAFIPEEAVLLKMKSETAQSQWLHHGHAMHLPPERKYKQTYHFTYPSIMSRAIAAGEWTCGILQPVSCGSQCGPWWCQWHDDILTFTLAFTMTSTFSFYIGVLTFTLIWLVTLTFSTQCIACSVCFKLSTLWGQCKELLRCKMTISSDPSKSKILLRNPLRSHQMLSQIPKFSGGSPPDPPNKRGDTPPGFR